MDAFQKWVDVETLEKVRSEALSKGDQAQEARYEHFIEDLRDAFFRVKAANQDQEQTLEVPLDIGEYLGDKWDGVELLGGAKVVVGRFG